MNFQVVIIDVTTPTPYELNTLAVQGLGGTEASVIRVAEGLGQTGIRVAVLEHNLEVPLEGKNAYYLPLSYLDQIVNPEIVIALRGCQYLDRFPRARKISWHEDVPNQVMLTLLPKFLEHDVCVVGASEWHKGAIQSLICDPNKIENPKVKAIYNPVPDSLYIPKQVEVKYDPNKIVFPFSPHKGLKNAMSLVQRYIDVTGNKDMRMHVFNPGYFNAEIEYPPFVVNHGPVPCAELWQHVSESLCVFYPSTFEETFCCIAAEANAVHTPVLCHEVAALAETISSARQFVEKDDKKIITTLESWRQGERPKVWGQERFKHTNVVMEWVKLFRNLLS